MIARSTGGYIFGGYTDAEWSSGGSYMRCDNAFLFRLCGPNATPSLHRIFQNHQHGIYCDAFYLPTFGGGHDLRLVTHGNQARGQFSIGYSYNGSGTGGHLSYLAEANIATVDEIEVFGCSA